MKRTAKATHVDHTEEHMAAVDEMLAKLPKNKQNTIGERLMYFKLGWNSAKLRQLPGSDADGIR